MTRKTSAQGKMLLSRNDLVTMGITASNVTLLRWEARKAFPMRVRLAGTRVVWLRDEVLQYLAAMAELRKTYVYEVND